MNNPVQCILHCSKLLYLAAHNNYSLHLLSLMHQLQSFGLPLKKTIPMTQQGQKNRISCQYNLT